MAMSVAAVDGPVIVVLLLVDIAFLFWVENEIRGLTNFYDLRDFVFFCLILVYGFHADADAGACDGGLRRHEYAGVVPKHVAE